MQGLDIIENYRDKESEIREVVDSSKKEISDLKKTINTDVVSNDIDHFKQLGNNEIIKQKIGFVLCYDKDSHLLVGDEGFAILNFDKQNGNVDFDKTIWISSEKNESSYSEIINTLGGDYDSFTIVGGDRIFSMKGNIRLDINTGKIIYSSEDIDMDTKNKLNSFGIKDLSVFYDKDFINSIIEKRGLVNKILELDSDYADNDPSVIKQKIDALKGNKPITLVLVPGANKTQASKYNNLDLLEKDNTVLYYQVSSESEFKSILVELQVLKKYGLNIDNFYFQTHADKKHIFFTSRGKSDEDMISFDDSDEFDKYNNLFDGTNIIMNACESGKLGGTKKNIVDFMSNGLFSNAKIIASPKFETYGVFNSDDFSEKGFVDNYSFYKQTDASHDGIKVLLTDNEKYIIKK